MNETIIISIISGVVTLIGTLLSVRSGNNKTQSQIKEHDELLAFRIKALEDKQDKHNSIIERTYKLEEKISVIDEKISVANHRIDDLERLTNGRPS